MGFFTSTKNIIIAVITAIIGGYVITQKIKAARAESKLQQIETKIAKTNVIVAKQVAKAKAEAKEVETSTEIEVLQTLIKDRGEALIEMDEIEKEIAETQKEKQVQVQGRTRGKAFKVEV